MAKTKAEKLNTEVIAEEEVMPTLNTEVEETNSAPKKEVKAVKENKPVNNGPSYEELMAIVQQLAGEVQALKSGNIQSQPSSDKTDKILEMLANRKSEKEITIIHNCEILGGGSTHIELTGMTIDFHTLGEQRLLSWQQFEECVSKYRSFFEREIILLSADEADLGQRYNIPCVKRNGKRILTHDEVINLGTLEVRALEDYINSLTDADKDFVFSYWLGKCYERTPGFYERYKIEMLNNLSGRHVFDNLLTLMNGDFRNEETK